ncbi:CAP domain-containing protein [Plantactinospora sp. KBS50]|uniref:CAP domain-containing protein n=1 Tax=Plantactinospora sp. KBS50 TaxID=2024580 RepID=UPI000BAA97D4|nr:CAP domain-containing protein [Plantactinospora sp. KBS50]ASW53993.1 hypothetical protein CIK06_07055 [Plantactinospora sp. KBS50]
MDGWNDPIDPHRGYRRTADQPASESWYDSGHHSDDPADRYPYRSPEPPRAAGGPYERSDDWSDTRSWNTDRHETPDRYAGSAGAGSAGAGSAGQAWPDETAGWAGVPHDPNGTAGYAAADGYDRHGGYDQRGTYDQRDGYDRQDGYDRRDGFAGYGDHAGYGDADPPAGPSARPAAAGGSAWRDMGHGAGGPEREPEKRRRLPRPALLAGAAATATLAVMIGVGAMALNSDSGQEARTNAAAGDASVATDGPELTDDDTPPLGYDDETDESGSPSPSPSATSAAAPAPTRKAAAAAPPRPSQSRTTRASSSPAATSSSASNAFASEEQQVIALVNQERAKAGCGNLVADSALMTAARLHSQDQAAHNNMSHNGSDGSTFDQRINRAGYSGRTLGENVAYGYPTPAAVMDGWMNSEGHRANILNCSFKDIGVGIARGSDKALYWTQDFGG